MLGRPGVVVVVVVLLVVVLLVVVLEVVDVDLGDATAAVDAIPTMTRVAKSATAPRDRSNIPLDLGIAAPHLKPCPSF
jgi:energy-converting hydrogenase Eha subunit F